MALNINSNIKLTDYKVLLFDLGGVIVPWRGIEALIAHTQASRAEIINLLTHSDIFNAYETGQCDDRVFLKEMVQLFDYNISLSEFSNMWNSWVKPPFPNILETLLSLKGKYTLACLSNTNALHWAHLSAMFNLNAVFDYCFASHLIQVAKPDPRSFTIPLEIMNVKAADVIFFDDTEINVRVASQEGLTAYHVNPSEGVVPILNSLLNRLSL